METRIELRVRTEEKAAWQSKAKLSGRSLSDWMREVLNGAAGDGGAVLPAAVPSPPKPKRESTAKPVPKPQPVPVLPPSPSGHLPSADLSREGDTRNSSILDFFKAGPPGKKRKGKQSSNP